MNRRTLATTLVTSVAMVILAGSLATIVLAAPPIVPLTAGTFHTCALTPSGAAMCWGAGGDGALGNGSTGNENEPVPVDPTALSSVAAISAGWYHTCALTTSGGAKCWGDDSGGQLGNGPNGGSPSPVPVTGYSTGGLVEISGGGFHTCAITTGGGVTCWGKNNLGQLGTGGTSDSNVPVANPTLTTGVTSIAAGFNHTCAIAGGELWCWGDNGYGQLGDGTQTVRHSPVHVSLPDEALAVAAGEGHTCALTGGGAVMCWGDNGYGQLGDSTFDEHLTPFPVTGLDSAVTSISSHGNHNCALTTSGGVLCWGDNIRGMLGDGSANNVRNEPVQVVGLTSGVAEIAAGYYHSCALTTSGVVKCWGYNFYGELGDGTNTNSNVPVDVSGIFGVADTTAPDIVVPSDIVAEATSPAGAPVTYTVTFSDPDDPVATSGCTPTTGSTFPLGTTTVACTATDSHGNSSSASFHITVQDTTAPTLTNVPSDITVAAGPSGDAVVNYANPTATDLVDGSVTVTCVPPSGSTFPLGSTLVTCSATDAHGNSASVSFTVTVLAQLPVAEVRLTAGAGQTCATRDSGALRCWGFNNHGQVGDGNAPVNALAAVPVPGLDAGVASVSGGGFHTCAVTVEGAASCWGYDASGQIGNGSFGPDVPEPVQVTGLGSGVAALTTGDLHTCALTTSGAVSCWGENNYGQLGDGTHDDRSLPVAVPSLTSGVVAIDAARTHTCALLNGGAVRCWGSNLYGQLGGGTSAEDSVVPLPVTGLGSGVTAIDGSSTFTCAITTAGDVKCWGVNFYGQLGDGTFDNSTTPVSVVGLPGPVRAITTGGAGTCALTTLGAVWCWGDNAFHQLGNGSDDPVSPRPVPVSRLGSGVTAIDGGESHFCAMSDGPFIQCWGWNPTGALGDGTLTTRSEPTAVHHFGADASINDVAVVEGDAGTTPATFTISLSEPSAETVTILWSTLGIDAFADDDYEGAVGTATFAPGDTSEEISVNVIGDTNVESDEQFSVRLERAANAAIEIDTGIATIRNDDVPQIAIDDVSVTEGDAGTTPATFAITLDRPSIHPVTVGWSTVAVDAIAGEDFAAASGIVTFVPGDVSEPIVIDVYGDTRFEPDETFDVLLSNPAQATIADGTGSATIVNDESDLEADVAISKLADHSTTNPVAPGQRLVYTISVLNVGPGTATDVQITDVLPGSSSPNDARWCEPLLTSGTCDTTLGDPYDTSTAIPPIATLPSGERRTFRIGYTVAADLPTGPIVNRASVATSSVDPNPVNDVSTTTVLVDAPPAVSFTWSPDLPVAGGLVRFDGGASLDPDGIARYEWAFGDGSTAVGATTAHSYSQDGAFVVSLTVTDAYGAQAVATNPVDVVRNTAPSAHRALTGTISQLVGWGPGDEPSATSRPLAGATVSVSAASGGSGVLATTATDADGVYSFINLTCPNGCYVTVRSGGTIVALPPRVMLGPDPSTTVLDIVTGAQQNQLFLSGRLIEPDSPKTPATYVAVRVYYGSALIADSAVLPGGKGGWGTYLLAVGQVGNQLRVGNTLRVVLVENGVEVRSTTVTIPAQTFAAVQVTAADLLGVDPASSAHRALTGTISQLVGWGPGDEPSATSRPLAGATVSVSAASGGSGVLATTATDADGVYSFINLTCPNGCYVTVRSGGTIVALPPRVMLGPDPSTTVLDIVTGAQQNQLFLSGRLIEPDSPKTPATYVAVRVYYGSALIADSAVLPGGKGGWGTYLLAVGQVGNQLRVGNTLRVVLVENGVEVRSTTVTIPAQTFAAVQVTAADLLGVDPASSAHRALTGTISQLVGWGPGDEPSATSRPLAGATVSVSAASGGSGVLATTATDADGVYSFINLTCPNGCFVTVRSGGTIVALPPRVMLGPDPSTTVLDIVTGAQQNQLFLSGRILPPPGPPRQAPVIAIRVYSGTSLVANSSVLYGGSGDWGTYRLALGQVGSNQLRVGTTLRVVLVENGVEVRSTTVTIPAQTFAAVQVTAADLIGQ